MEISKHITYREATRSNTAIKRGIKNQPNEKQLAAMVLLAEKVFEPVRVYFGKPIRINSFFRSAKLNTIIGGSGRSQHCKGEAVDLDGLNGLTNSEIFHYIKDNLEFDQMIWEFGTSKEPDWVHVSYTNAKPNRKQVLKASRKGGRTVYEIFK